MSHTTYGIDIYTTHMWHIYHGPCTRTGCVSTYNLRLYWRL